MIPGLSTSLNLTVFLQVGSTPKFNRLCFFMPGRQSNLEVSAAQGVNRSSCCHEGACKEPESGGVLSDTVEQIHL